MSSHRAVPRCTPVCVRRAFVGLGIGLIALLVMATVAMAAAASSTPALQPLPLLRALPSGPPLPEWQKCLGSERYEVLNEAQ